MSPECKDCPLNNICVVKDESREIKVLYFNNGFFIFIPNPYIKQNDIYSQIDNFPSTREYVDPINNSELYGAVTKYVDLHPDRIKL
jgi:hypothetical protein